MDLLLIKLNVCLTPFFGLHRNALAYQLSFHIYWYPIFQLTLILKLDLSIIIPSIIVPIIIGYTYFPAYPNPKAGPFN